MKITKKKASLLGIAATTLLIVPGFSGCVYGPGPNYSGNPASWDGTFEDIDTGSAEETSSVTVDTENTAESSSDAKEKE